MSDRFKKVDRPVGSGDIFFKKGPALPSDLKVRGAEMLVKGMRERVEGELPSAAIANSFAMNFVASEAREIPLGKVYALPAYGVRFYLHASAGIVVVKDGFDEWGIDTLPEAQLADLKDDSLVAVMNALNHVIAHPSQIGCGKD